MTRKSFGFKELAAQEQQEGEGAKVDLAQQFPPKTAPGVDQGAADAARRVGQETKLARHAPSPQPKRKTPYSRVKLTDVVPGLAPSPEARTQLNISAPVSLAQQFKQKKLELGYHADWQLIEELLRAYDRK